VDNPRVMRHRLFALCFLVGLTACAPFIASKTEAGNWLSVLSNVSSLEGVTYLPGYAYGSHSRQKLDVYVPNTPSVAPRPVFVFGYGGGYADGNRDEYRFVGAAFAQMGFVTIIYDYRLYPEVNFPTYLEDAALALRWVKDRVVRFGGDSSRLVLAGHSAGAHIAAMLAVNPRYLQGVGMTPRDLKLVLCLSGGYDFYDPRRTQNQGFISADIARVMGNAPLETQPITFLTPREPPMLLVHGRNDAILPVEQARTFVQRAKRINAPVTYLEYDLDHASTVTMLAQPLRTFSSVHADLQRELETRGLIARK
jgi:acetyl esterase/lipase